MLTEEAHHMFVGESGVGRIIQRTSEAMMEHKIDDPAKIRALGLIDLPTIQRYLNFHFSVTMDLFGADVSSNAATFYSTGLKGRFDETKIGDDHALTDATYPVLEVRTAARIAQAPALNALNEKLRDDYVKGRGRRHRAERSSMRHRVPTEGAARRSTAKSVRCRRSASIPTATRERGRLEPPACALAGGDGPRVCRRR
jgi:hypothetical protein